MDRDESESEWFRSLDRKRDGKVFIMCLTFSNSALLKKLEGLGVTLNRHSVDISMNSIKMAK